VKNKTHGPPLTCLPSLLFAALHREGYQGCHAGAGGSPPPRPQLRRHGTGSLAPSRLPCPPPVDVFRKSPSLSLATHARLHFFKVHVAFGSYSLSLFV
jgi:hypothetical protein